VITITSVDIENSGASTAGEVLRELPESFAGGQQSTIGVNGQGPYQNLANFNYSDSANLRGFGSDSTLVLINGHRAPVTGLQNSVDISAVPLPAIDRIEVVTDGASALYGSDAVGGVVNLILKNDYSGAESRAEFGIPTEGGGFSQKYGQLFGTTWEGGSALISYHYRDQQGIYGSQRNWYTGPDPLSLNPSIHQNSVFFDASQQVNSNLRVFAEGLYNRTTSFGIATHPSGGTDYLTTVGYTYNATVPLVGAQTARMGAQELILTLAGRYEDYSDVGTHFSPLIGLSYEPLQAIRLRGTWNRSFLAPALYEKYSSYYALLYPVEAPTGGSTVVIIPAGGNFALQPETANSFTLGAD
jgi:outer membrane cobalamin receptor